MCASTIRVALSTSMLLAVFGATGICAQTPGDQLRSEFPELGALFNAFDVAQAAMFESVAEIGVSSQAASAREQLRQRLAQMSNMTMPEMMQMQAGGMPGMDMMVGPFGELEAEVASELRQLIEETHSVAEARGAFSNSAPLTPRAATVLARGREFEDRIFDIYADAAVSDKYAAVNAAVDEYLSDGRDAVPAAAKSPALVFGHRFAAAFSTGYPELSGVIWAGQWLQLASLEPLMLGGSSVRAGVDTTLERFRSKMVEMPGMSMLPSEMPMVPAISPLLYSRHSEAASIIDNLNMLETVIADLLVHPDVQDRAGSIDAVVDEFTNGQTNMADDREYLLAALRGGIFNQGGPALGELARSERNRSRMEMEMGHIMMPGMN